MTEASDGGHIARPIWEYFFAKALADKSLGLDRNARFVKPDSLNTNLQLTTTASWIKRLPPAPRAMTRVTATPISTSTRQRSPTRIDNQFPQKEIIPVWRPHSLNQDI